MERKFLSAVAYALRTSYKLGNEQAAWHLKSALLHARAHDGASANSAKHSAHPEPVRAIYTQICLYVCINVCLYDMWIHNVLHLPVLSRTQDYEQQHAYNARVCVVEFGCR